ncbi:HAD family hydrolase [Amycolatopsis sp. CA-126428]|uniref:HAD family hydrolase n=1 Tax=Amycolatopsis sp. CA-126428 TaxID=2073158 RepID=UPI000CD13F2B
MRSTSASSLSPTSAITAACWIVAKSPGCTRNAASAPVRPRTSGPRPALPARLRERFGLSEYITDWFVSEDIGVRKPAPEAFATLSRRLDVIPEWILLIDDREANVAAARTAGLQALRFSTPQLSTTDQLRRELRPW